MIRKSEGNQAEADELLARVREFAQSANGADKAKA
jgi:hypothetical protein